MLLNDLPFDVLGQILAKVDDIGTLANAALSCRQLHQVVYDPKETLLWKTIHDRLYDCPAQASAYPPDSQRELSGWRNRVVDRDFTVRFLLRHEACLQQLQQEFGDLPDLYDRWEAVYPANRGEAWLKVFCQPAPRILTTVLSLYHELPSPSHPSLNAPILLDIARCLSFQFLLTQAHRHQRAYVDYEKVSDLEREAHWHFHALAHQLLCRFISIPPYRVQDEFYFGSVLRGLPARVIRFGGSAREQDWTSGPSLNWWALRGVMTEMLGAGERFTDEGLDGARGPGLIDIPPRPAREVWDWAGVGGTWRATTDDLTFEQQLLYQHLDLPGNQAVRVDGHFDLVAVAGMSEIRAAFKGAIGASSSNKQEYCIDLMPFHLKEEEVGDALPPIYFHSTRFVHDAVNTSPNRVFLDPLIEPRPAMFIYGMVHVTSDSPPELIWTMTAEAIGYPQESQLLKGVFAGGRRSPLGVLGAWNLKRKIYGPNADVYNETEGVLPYGPAWITRVDE